MKKRSKKQENKVKKLIVACGICAIILTVSTYAWFIGMKTVNVSAFEVNIASIDGLSLSLNGVDWYDEVTINEANHLDPDTVGAGSTNIWGELIPMSSIGKINDDSSRLILYEKGSLTATPGGYRIMASEVNNDGTLEAKGYVAFDLFIKNQSGNAYYPEFNKLNEEAIYLTPESEVAVADTGAKADKSGIENSVRVAFAQIGRVVATTETTDGSEIRSISCKDVYDDTGVTSICSKRDAQIWEPNDTKHVDNAISWYTTSCRPRTGTDVTLSGSFDLGGTCGTVKDGGYSQTYAIGREIDYTDNVDVYDGAPYNGYTQSITNGSLVAFDYFTDTEKNLPGTDRPEFMSLAPNSITKVRIYVYIEGQDVDNYDFASLGKKISVAFGFTKQRFYGEDIDYEGPQLPEDVIKYQSVSYPAGNGKTIVSADSRVTFDDETDTFTVPRWFTKFTFTEDGQPKVAKYEVNKWIFEDQVID